MEKIDFKNIKRIHFIGIKGVGMAPLAIVAKEAGFLVSGCDIADDFITDQPLAEAKIPVNAGFSEQHLTSVDLVITTGAHGGYDNPEVKAAKANNLPVVTQGEAVGLFMKGELFHKQFKGISVAGCHGKTTTTAMLATMFSDASLKPAYLIGTSNINPIGLPGHFGGGDYFIAEADEYATEPKYDHTPKFLWQHPEIAVITNIEHDHPDLYPTIDDTRDAYWKFANNLISASSTWGMARRNENHALRATSYKPKSGLLIACGDDEQVQKLLKDYHGNVITYGSSLKNDYQVHDIHTESGQTIFTLDTKHVSIGTFTLNVVGDHNALNAAAAIIVGIESGISLRQINHGLLAFRGTKRRFEIIDNLPSGALLIDDYAHHPTEIKKTLRAAKDMFPNKKIIAIFQPHTFSRTKLLFKEFSSSFINADEVILTDIYPSAREAADPSISSEVLANSVRKFNRDVIYLSKLIDVVKYIKQKGYDSGYVIITMGAGDVYKISKDLVENC